MAENETDVTIAADATETAVTIPADSAETVTVATPAATVTVTPAHTQAQTIHVVEWYPEHLPRKNDAHYILFEAARKRLAAADKLVCYRCGSRDNPELHHTLIEYSLQNGVDIARFEERHPEFGLTDDESFFRWVEQDANNLTVLCVPCHRGAQGIHCIPFPIWEAGLWWKTDQPAAGVVTGAPVLIEADVPPGATAKDIADRRASDAVTQG